MNADKILPILCRYLKDTDNRLLAKLVIIVLLVTTILAYALPKGSRKDNRYFG